MLHIAHIRRLVDSPFASSFIKYPSSLYSTEDGLLIHNPLPPVLIDAFANQPVASAPSCTGVDFESVSYAAWHLTMQPGCHLDNALMG
jgi:hypothetical protein